MKQIFRRPHHSQFSLCLGFVGQDVSSQLLLSAMPACLPVCCQTHSHDGHEPTGPLDPFFHKLTWSWYFVTALKQELRRQSPKVGKISFVSQLRGFHCVVEKPQYCDSQMAVGT